MIVQRIYKMSLGFYFVICSVAYGATDENPDLQLRMPFHLQLMPEERRVGLGAWAVLPNVLAKGNQSALLTALGPLIEYDRKGSWIEFMGGSRLNDNGYVDPMLNVRLLDKNIPRVSLGADLEYFPREEQSRFYSLLSADTPVQIGPLSLRFGIESENIFSFSGKKDSLGVGPRIQYLLPLRSAKFSAAVTASYEFRTDRDFARIYFGLTYRPFAKKK